MQMICRFFLSAVFVMAPMLAAAHNELAREPRGIDTLVPTSSPSQADSSSQKITIYTAKTIVTLDLGTPSAEAVAVMNGKILGVGTLDEVRGWITNEEFEVNRRFQDAVIIPGFIEAHMHPQFTGVLWQGVYVGRFDRTAPDGTPIKGFAAKQAVIEQLRNAAAKIPADGKWLVAWGYQPEFYGNSPLTRADLDPISNGHPIFVENLSMHIYYANSKAFETTGITDKTDIVGIVKQAGEPTGEIEEIPAALAFVAKLPTRSDTFILLAAQKNASDDEPATEAIYEVGTLASVLQLLKLPDGTVKVLVEGAQRAKVVKYIDCSEYYEAEAVALGDTMDEVCCLLQ